MHGETSESKPPPIDERVSIPPRFAPTGTVKAPVALLVLRKQKSSSSGTSTLRKPDTPTPIVNYFLVDAIPVCGDVHMKKAQGVLSMSLDEPLHGAASFC